MTKTKAKAKAKARTILVSEEAWLVISDLAVARSLKPGLRDLSVQHEKARKALILVLEIEDELAQRIQT